MNYKTYKSLQSQKERLLNEIADRVANVLAEADFVFRTDDPFEKYHDGQPKRGRKPVAKLQDGRDPLFSYRDIVDAVDQLLYVVRLLHRLEKVNPSSRGVSSLMKTLSNIVEAYYELFFQYWRNTIKGVPEFEMQNNKSMFKLKSPLEQSDSLQDLFNLIQNHREHFKQIFKSNDKIQDLLSSNDKNFIGRATVLQRQILQFLEKLYYLHVQANPTKSGGRPGHRHVYSMYSTGKDHYGPLLYINRDDSNEDGDNE